MFAAGCLVFILMTFLAYKLWNTRTVLFLHEEGPFLNPLMGWAPWATIERSQQPHTLVYADLTWRDFEPLQGQFDFDSFKERNQLDRWRAQGKRVVFRFVMDVPRDERHKDIPDWLYDAIGGDGDWYDHAYGQGFSPNYANPLLITYHQKAIRALGQPVRGG